LTPRAESACGTGDGRLTGIAGASVCERLGIRGAGSPMRKTRDWRGRLSRSHGHSLRRAVAPPADDFRTGPAVGAVVPTHSVIDHKISQGTILLLHDAPEPRSSSGAKACTRKRPKTLDASGQPGGVRRVHACSSPHTSNSKFRAACDVRSRPVQTGQRHYGHQRATSIKCLASLLKSYCRPGDLVARYGGEEFVVLCRVR